MSTSPPVVRHELRFSPEIAQRLARFGEDPAEALRVVFVAAVGALLSRYAGREQIALPVQAPDGQRRVLNVRVDGDPDAPELCRRVAKELASAGLTDGVRIEQLVPGTASGIEVCLALDAAEAFSFADLTINARGPSLELVFRAEQFESSAVARIAEHLRALVIGLADYSGPVSAIAWVQGEERAWLLEKSNAAAVQLDERLPSVVEHFERHVREAPNSVAVVDGNRTLTYRQLQREVAALGGRLRERGVGSGVRVAVYLDRGADAIIAFLAILTARGTYVPIDTNYPRGRAAAIMTGAAPAVVVTQASAADTVAAFSAGTTSLALVFVEATREDEPEGIARESSAPRPEDAAYTFFTSGSTGQPKGVVVDHRTLSNYARAAFDAYGLRAEDRVLQAASLGFDLSLEEIVITLTAGATLVVRSAPSLESVQEFFEECVEQRLTVLSITCALWHELTVRLADGTVRLPPLLRLVILGADAARPDALLAWQQATFGRVRLVNTYGLTETTIVATTWEADMQPLASDWRALPIGRPLRNVSVYVLDSRNELLPVGVAGEICIGGLAVAREYLGDEKLTQARFVADPYLPGARMYRSGDRGIMRSTGELEFIGRADYQVKVRGVRIELGEVEARLREFPGVIEAIAITWKNNLGETEIDGHVTVSMPDVTTGQLRAHLQRLLPAAAVPARLHISERFPLTPAGKIDRRALAAAAPELPRTPFVAPKSPLERLVVATVAEVLGEARIGLDDEFLALGGTSLAAVRVASLLGPRLGRRLSSRLFLESRTLAQICTELASGDARAHDPEPLLRLLQADATLAPIIVGNVTHSQPAPLHSVLLTGATGYYGAFVLDELLRATQAEVVCLVRAPTPKAARQRVLANLVRLGCVLDASLIDARVSFVCADIAQSDFGLAPETFASLSERVDAVFHVAAQVSMLLPYQALRASNALALEWVLRLATTARPKTVHHVSTVEVLTDQDPRSVGALAERATAQSPALLDSGYAQSKWVAEKLIEQARARGVRAYIHRAGRLVSHASSGAFNEDDFLIGLLSACDRIGAAPVLDVIVDMTPVDAASRALVRLARNEPTQGTFHLVHPCPPTWASLLETIIALGNDWRPVAHSEWRSLLQEACLREVQPTFLQYVAGLSQGELEASLHGGYESSVTSLALGRAFEWPAIDARFVARCLAALRGQGDETMKARSGRGSTRTSTDAPPRPT